MMQGELQVLPYRITTKPKYQRLHYLSSTDSPSFFPHTTSRASILHFLTTIATTMASYWVSRVGEEVNPLLQFSFYSAF